MNLKQIEDEALHLSEQERAESEHLESVASYESKRAGLGASYLARFERVMRTVREAPHGYLIEKEPDVRRIRMKKFPYIVLFRESSGFGSGAGGGPQPASSAILAGQTLKKSIIGSNRGAFPCLIPALNWR
jgi:hypothetical protein